MKTKNLLLILVLVAWTASLSAQITQEQANGIVLEYLANENIGSGTLFRNVNLPSEDGIIITTYDGETMKAKYACWTYCFAENKNQIRYLFVKVDNGSLLEAIAYNDSGISDSSSWEIVEMNTGLTEKDVNVKLLYPNPVGDWLKIPCIGDSTRVEIYDLKGTRLFSGTLSGENTCRLNVSFLSAGFYMVNVEGETYKIVKN